MDDPEEAMKSMIENALNECHDVELLDLIYKLLAFNN